LSANVDAQRYQSHGLRFDHQRKNESVSGSTARKPSERNIPRQRPAASEPQTALDAWRRQHIAGSLHCDVWTGPAIELLNRDTLCVKPINGCGVTGSTDICNRKSRYALIVTLKARNADLDIYTPVCISIAWRAGRDSDARVTRACCA